MPWTQTETRLREALGEAEKDRALLIQHALASVPKVSSLAVPDDVKEMIEEHFLALVEPAPVFDSKHPWFPAWLGIVKLKRFPAGQLDFEYDGLPRSWLWKVPWGDRARLAACVATQLGGFRPCFFTHVAVKRKSRLMLEAENNRAYHRVARTLKLQPGVRGLMTVSWFHSPETFRVSPHLHWFNKVPSENGALVTTLGPAPLDSGIFERSPERKKLYDEGKFHPTEGLVLWPRKPLIEWADGHPEWGRA